MTTEQQLEEIQKNPEGNLTVLKQINQQVYDKKFETY
jgi:hypothetical protein